MNGVATRFARERDDLLAVQVRGRALPAQRSGLVGLASVQRGDVVLGVDGDGVDAELRGGADHTDRDLAAVGDQQ